MDCTRCQAETVAFSLPSTYRDPALLPDGFADVDGHGHRREPALHRATICPRCLTVRAGPVDAECDESGPSALEGDRVDRIASTFPRDADAAVPLALALACCESMAHNREPLSALLECVERAGVDPLLTIDRLLDDPSIEPAVDLERRRHQLEQLHYG